MKESIGDIEVEATSPETEEAPKRKGGWPKGKPRGPRGPRVLPQQAVNAEEAQAADQMLTQALVITARLPVAALKLEPELTQQEEATFVVAAKPCVLKWFPEVASAIPVELILLAVCWGIYGQRYMAKLEKERASKESVSNGNIGNGQVNPS